MRNYFADFIIGKLLIEIKPKRLINSPLLRLKELQQKFGVKQKN